MIEAFILLVIGPFFGSFFLVVIDRLAQEKNPLTGRSVCDHCGHVLGWYDLIPLVSFFSLGGKCRFCKAELSWYHPSVEFVTGVLFAVTPFLLVSGSKYHLSASSGQGVLGIDLVFSLFIVSIFIIIFFTDLKYGIIPFIIVIPAGVISLLFHAVTNPPLVFQAILSAIGAGLFFYSIYLITRGKGMGFGDVVLAVFLGLLLGFPGIVTALYVAFLTGAFGSLILILTGRKKMKGSTIPFGPFLILGAYITFFWGERISSYLYQLLS